MKTAAEKRLVTFEEFCVLVNEDQKADLIDGVIYMASPENIEANDIFLWLAPPARRLSSKKKTWGRSRARV